MSAALVPDRVGHGADALTVQRAWPTSRVTAAGERMLAAEGTDAAGRVRAARLRVQWAEHGWQVVGQRVAPPGVDAKVPDLAEAVRGGGQVVVHRWGKRAVVRRPDRFVKVVRPGAADAIADQALRGAALAERAGFAAPQVLAVGSGRVDFGVLPGTGLHELGRDCTLADWRRWWADWATRWPSLVRCGGEVLGAHTASDEQRNLRRWTDQVATLGMLPATLAAPFIRRVGQVCELLGEGADQELGVSHRDLHDKQVLAGDGALGLLDFDTAALAEPALDLGNLLVHVRLRVDQQQWSPAHGTVATEQVLCVADALEVPAERLAVYAEATRLRLACLYLFRPRHRALALRWAAQEGLASPARMAALEECG